MKTKLEEIRHTKWAGQKIFYFPVIDSTNQKAKQLGEEGCPHGTLVIAEQQEVGRGRRGRSWECPAGAGIFMTLVLRPEICANNAPMMTLVAALAVSAAITKKAGVTAEIKWPNDIVINGKKVCGILTEMSIAEGQVSYIVLGIGINAHNTDFPEEISDRATSLYLETKAHLDRAELTEEILEQFEHYYAVFMKTEELEGLAEEYNSRLVNRNRRVKVLDEKEPFEGRAVGITVHGELMVDTEQGQRLVSAGEVSVRGIYGYV